MEAVGVERGGISLPTNPESTSEVRIPSGDGVGEGKRSEPDRTGCPKAFRETEPRITSVLSPGNDAAQ